MKKIRVILFFWVGMCFFGADVFAQTPAVKPSPENWLKKKGSELVSILSEEETKTRYVKLRRIAREVFNQQEMTRLSMGRYWRDLSRKRPPQKPRRKSRRPEKMTKAILKFCSLCGKLRRDIISGTPKWKGRAF